MPPIVFDFYAVLCGLLLGSFFNVLIWRMPRGESFIRPRSHCPGCGRTIPALENIPVLSYLALRGRCAGCRAHISIRYPLVEIVSAAATLALWRLLLAPAVHAGATPWHYAHLAAQCLTLLLMIPIAIIDIDHYIIPNQLTFPGIALAAALSVLPGAPTPLQALYGMLAGGASLWLFGKLGELLFRKGQGMGLGDVKLMAWAGALFGWRVMFVTILAASLTGTIAGAALMALRKLRGDHRIPFGPFLAAGLWIAVLWGDTLLAWYQGVSLSIFIK